MTAEVVGSRPDLVWFGGTLAIGTDIHGPMFIMFFMDRFLVPDKIVDGTESFVSPVARLIVAPVKLEVSLHVFTVHNVR